MTKRMNFVPMASLSLFILMNSQLAFGKQIAPDSPISTDTAAGSSHSIAKHNPSSISSAKKIAAVQSASQDQIKFDQLSEKYFESLFHNDPDAATVMGIHTYDNLAPDYSAGGIAEKIASFKSYLKEFESLSPDSLSPQGRIDRQLIISDIKSHLLMSDELRAWEKNPDMYSSDSSSMIYNLMTRDFAPLPDRLKSVIAREKMIPSMLRAGKANVKNPPRIYTEIALSQLPGIIDFFTVSVPEKFKSVSDKDLQNEFTRVNADVIAQLKDYQKYLQDDLLPKSNGTFAFGADIYSKKLLYDEMVDAPLDKVLADGESELKRLQKEFVETAKAIDPTKTPLEVFVSISSEHPAPEKLISSVSGVLNMLKTYCSEKNIVTVPQEDDLKVGETPPFARALSFASMDSPGPFEKAKEAYYYVTLPEADWTAERTEEHMRSFCTQDLLNTSVHEAFPGHYLQGLWNRNSPSKTTKILSSNSNVEGWAHYCEQMMVEEGLQNNDPKLKLTMLHDALLRCCRYIVGIRMHTKGMTMQQAIDFFVKEGYMEKANAERETKRGTMDATYLVYTLGKLQILELREDYKKAKGANYSLKDFHDRFLATGCPPVKIIREIMLGSNTK